MAAPKVLTRDQSKELTRRRLLRAAVGILNQTGAGGLSASAVSRAAGIAQSTFYVHFRDKDALLRTLGDEAHRRMRRAIREARARAREEPQDSGALRARFRVPLEIIAANPALFTMSVRSRLESDSPLGDSSRELLRLNRQDLVEDFALAGWPADTPAMRRRQEMIADGFLYLVEAMAFGHLEGRYPDLEEAVDVLVAFSRGAAALGRGVSRPDAS